MSDLAPRSELGSPVDAALVYSLHEDAPLNRRQRTTIQAGITGHVHAHERSIHGQARGHLDREATVRADAAELLAGLDALVVEAERRVTPDVAKRYEVADAAAEGLEARLREMADMADFLAVRLADPLASLAKLQRAYPALKGVYGERADAEGLDRLRRALDNVDLSRR